MLEGIGDFISSMITSIAQAIHGLARLVFRLEPTDILPTWTRVFAIIVVIAGILFFIGVLVTFFAAYLFIAMLAAAITAVAGLVAFLGLG